MKNIKKLVPVGSFIALVFFVWVLPTWRAAQEAEYASSMSSLSTEVKDSLESYYQVHKRYPARLTALPTHRFKYYDSSSPQMLNDLKYSVSLDGQKFVLSWQGRWSRTVKGEGNNITSARNDKP